MKTSEERADLRVRRTHKLLWEALMALMAERAFEEITVKEICDQAMVHRTTFYKHYEDKYALLEQGMRQMYDALVAEVTVPPSAFSVAHPPSYFIHLFIHVAEHQHFYKLMLCGEGIGRFQKLVKDYLVEQGEAIIHAFTPTNQKPAVPTAMYVQYVAGAVISILAWWLEHDMPYSPQQMAQYLLVLHGTSSYHS
jgi:AcrR family transcriptional regulator